MRNASDMRHALLPAHAIAVLSCLIMSLSFKHKPTPFI